MALSQEVVSVVLFFLWIDHHLHFQRKAPLVFLVVNLVFSLKPFISQGLDHCLQTTTFFIQPLLHASHLFTFVSQDDNSIFMPRYPRQKLEIAQGYIGTAELYSLSQIDLMIFCLIIRNVHFVMMTRRHPKELPKMILSVLHAMNCIPLIFDLRWKCDNESEAFPHNAKKMMAAGCRNWQ